MRLWHTTRTQNEINDNRFVRLTGCEEDLILYYDFNEGGGTEIYDKARHTYSLFNGGIDWETGNGPIEDCASPTPDGNPLVVGLDGYRYGFNGMEKDDEVKGKGNSYDFGARIHDPRLGRWLSVDPLQRQFPWSSPYNVNNNNPIIFIDQDGRTGIIYLSIIDKSGKTTKVTLIDSKSTKDFERYNHFFDDGSTWTSKWDYTQSATLDFRDNPNGEFMFTSNPELTERVDWRAKGARWLENPMSAGGIAMSSSSGRGGAMKGEGDGRILNVDGLVEALGGLASANKIGFKQKLDVVKVAGNYEGIYTKFDDLFKELDLEIDISKDEKPKKPKFICPNCGQAVEDTSGHREVIGPDFGPFTPAESNQNSSESESSSSNTDKEP